jgi:hypothetical protein
MRGPTAAMTPSGSLSPLSGKGSGKEHQVTGPAKEKVAAEEEVRVFLRTHTLPLLQLEIWATDARPAAAATTLRLPRGNRSSPQPQPRRGSPPDGLTFSGMEEERRRGTTAAAVATREAN